MSERSQRNGLLNRSRTRKTLREQAYARALETSFQNSAYRGEFDIVLPCGMFDDVYEFLFKDPSRECLGVILAGTSERGNHTKLLGRVFIPVEGSDLESSSLGAVRASKKFSADVMALCAATGLSQIDVHSHPFGASPRIDFSGIDDHHEYKMAEYVYRHLPQTYYASLVLNQSHFNARVWLGAPHEQPTTHKTVRCLTLASHPFVKARPSGDSTPTRAADFVDRQVLAFGAAGQALAAEVVVGIIGLGGLGSILVDGLVRLGVEKFVLVDPDRAEVSNLNRVVGMTRKDATRRTRKTEIARRLIQSVNPSATVTPVSASLFEEETIEVLKTVDILFVATDDHATRMISQAFSSQYLIPLLSVGVQIAIDENGTIQDISGEVVLSLSGPNGTCLACLDRYNPARAGLELSLGEERRRAMSRGYIEADDIPAPSVRHLNGVVASLALAEFHNLLAPFKEPAFWLEYDQLASSVRRRRIVSDPSCVMCGADGRLGRGDLDSIASLFRQQDEIAVLRRVPTVAESEPPDIERRGLPSHAP